MNIQIKRENKFKTISVVLKCKSLIDRHQLTERSILSKLMTKVTARFPSEEAMHKELAELYGAHLFSYVTKQKNTHVLTIGIEFINHRFLSADEQLIERAIQLLAEVVKHPLADEKAFDANRIAVEKQLLQARMDAAKDNKTQYGFQQLLYTMFNDNDYQYPSYGIEAELASVTPESVYQAYTSMINDDEKDLYVIGDVDEEQITDWLNIYLDLPSRTVVAPPFNLRADEPTYVTEESSTAQAKINMGFYEEVTYGSKNYFAFVVMNQLFGGDVTSLLFTNVREKLSLAYQIHSQIDARLGLLYVIAGVNKEAKDKSINTILEQLDMLKTGDFDESMLQTAKIMLISQRKESFDRPRGWIETTYAQTFDDTKLSKEEWIKGIEAATKDEVTSAAQQLKLHTVYCLTDEVQQ